MSKSNKHQIVSNRMRSISRGSYTDIFREEAAAESRKRANLALQMSRAGGRRW